MKVLICDKLDDQVVGELTQSGHDVTVKTGLPAEELAHFISPFEVAVVRSATKLTAPILERATHLKLIVRAGVGLDNIDLRAASAREIAVHNTPEATSITVAEHAFALMLSLARHIPQASTLLKKGKWEKKAFSGTELFRKKIGIIGFGRIGQEVGKRAKAFHMEVSIFDPGIDLELVSALEVKKDDDFEAFLSECDYVTLHIPHNDSTHYLINAASIQKMKKGAFLINCARGGIVDEAAVLQAVTDGHLAGAAFDVFEKEPLSPDSPLLQSDKIICLPHLGASTDEGQSRAGLEVVNIINTYAQSGYSL